MTGMAIRATSSFTSLDTTQTSRTHRTDPEWTHQFRHGVADALAALWPTRAARIRRCGEAAIAVRCADCGALHLFPERCAGRTCPTCARRAATATAVRIGERIQIHDRLVESGRWEGPGDPSRGAWGDGYSRAWKLLTLTTPATEDPAARLEPDILLQCIRIAREAFPGFWRSTPWGRQVRDPNTRSKRVRRDTSAVTALEVAPGGMVHVHALIYSEFSPQAFLADKWGKKLGLEEPAVVDIRSVDVADVAGGIREALKYATKGAGTRRDQVMRAAAVEYALANTKRVSILGALRRIKGRSTDVGSEDARPEDLHADHEASCEECGSLGRWSWSGLRPPAAVTTNEGWGLVHSVPPRSRHSGS